MPEHIDEIEYHNAGIFYDEYINAGVYYDERLNEIVMSNSTNPMTEKNSQELFHNGLYCLYVNDMPKAKEFFLKALDSTEIVDDLHWKYLSFLGLSEVLTNHSRGGLHRCYEASKECPNNSELYLNIAYAEQILGNRQRCIKALKCCLDIEPSNTMANVFYDRIGRRVRKNPIKNIVGKYWRRIKPVKQTIQFNQIIKDNISITLDNYVNKIIQSS